MTSDLDDFSRVFQQLYQEQIETLLRVIPTFEDVKGKPQILKELNQMLKNLKECGSLTEKEELMLKVYDGIRNDKIVRPLKEALVKSYQEKLRREPKTEMQAYCARCRKVHSVWYDHSGCIWHGHCLKPVDCVYFQSCPIQVNDTNRVLAWA